VLVDDDVAGAELLGIIVSSADGDRSRMMETVPESGGARRNPVDFDRDYVLAQDRDDPMQRAYPAEAAVAPAHRLGPWEVGDDALDRLGEDGGGCLARPLDRREQHSIAIFKLFALEARLAEEALERLLGCVRARAFQFFSRRFRRFRHIADDQH